jgi:UDP-N-acetylglucosamine:LPS N-acetylglucosamine transferase
MIRAVLLYTSAGGGHRAAAHAIAAELRAVGGEVEVHDGIDVTGIPIARAGRALVMPFAARGQERGNLAYAVAAGAAVRPGAIADLGDVLSDLLVDPGRLRRMGARARSASHPDAAARVARCVLGDLAARPVEAGVHAA